MEMEMESKSKPSSSSNPATQNFVPSAPNVRPPPVEDTQTVIVYQTYEIYPTRITCPYCRTRIITRIEHDSNPETHLTALLLCLLGGCCCFFIPYCVDGCKSVNHYCPKCHSYLGTGRDDSC